MLYQLPPVGNPVSVSVTARPESFLGSFFSPYKARFFTSGTAALAAAICVAKRLKRTDSPEVIIPAYGCPDLVSAAVFSGVKPVLVDLEPDRPWMHLGDLDEKINASTVAVVAASLLGIPERMEQLRGITDRAGVLLIEDSAQSFPVSEGGEFWKGDLVVLSFGRGKPVSLLGGGGVLYREQEYEAMFPASGQDVTSKRNGSALLPLKIALYNWMISPWVYWLPQFLPFLHLGETRFHSLESVGAMDDTRLALLPANIAAYRDHKYEIQQAMAEILANIPEAADGIIDLPSACNISRNQRLLRYPLLLNESARSRLCGLLAKSGSGASLMYPAIIPEIPGLEGMFREQGAFPAAESFADRILTLPLHGRVSARDIANIRRALRSVM